MTSTTVSCPPAGLSPASQRRARQLAALPAGGSRLAGSSPQGRGLLEAVAGLESGPSLNQSLTDPRMTTGPSRSLCLQPAVPAPLILYHGSRELCVILIIVLLSHVILWKWHQATTILESGGYPPPKRTFYLISAINYAVQLFGYQHLFIFQYVYMHIM